MPCGPSSRRSSRCAATRTALAADVRACPTAAAPTLTSIFWVFAKAGAFVFGSGLAIVPFLYGELVQSLGWLNDRQFLDAVAVAMITPGPVVITVAFIYGLFVLGGRIYTGAVLQTGGRIKLRDAWRSAR